MGAYQKKTSQMMAKSGIGGCFNGLSAFLIHFIGTPNLSIDDLTFDIVVRF